MSAELPPPTLDQLEDPSLLDRIRDVAADVRTKLGRIGASTLLATGAAVGLVVTDETPAMADGPEATVGMPFAGKWAYNALVNPPYTDNNSSHPSAHAAYGFDWATDIYAGGGTEVKVYGSSSQGTVTFQRKSTSDTCSSYGANIAGRGVTFDVLVNGADVGDVKYDHLDLTDVGNNPIASGTKIGTVTTEPLNSSCFQTRHAHVQFKNADNYACYTDHGQPGVTLAEGTSLGRVGSDNTGAKQACSNIAPPPPDTDGDGVADPQDACPTVPGPAYNNGCPVVQHVYTGTQDGKVHETYWGGGNSLTTAEMTDVDSPVTAVTNQISGGVHHIYFGTQGGEVYETYWGAGNTVTTSMLTDLNTPINAISSQIYNGVQHVYSGTEAGKLHETSWGSGVPLSTWQVANIGSAVTSLSSLITPNGVQSLFSGSADGKIKETYWGGGNTLTSYQLASLPNRVNGLAFYVTADGTRHVFSGTSAGKVYETYWGGGNSLTTAEMATLPTAVTGISAQQSSNGVNHIYTGTQGGTLHETYWGNGNSLTTSQVGNVDSPVKGLSSLITPDGVQHMYSGTEAGTLHETYWGGGNSLTTSQLAGFPTPVGSVFSRLT